MLPRIRSLRNANIIEKCFLCFFTVCSSFCWTLVGFCVAGKIHQDKLWRQRLHCRRQHWNLYPFPSRCFSHLRHNRINLLGGLQAKVNHPPVSWLTVMISLSFIWLNEVTVLGEVLFPRYARPWPQPDQICWKSLGPSVKRKRSGASTSSTTCCRGPAKNCAVRDFPAFPHFPSQLSRTKNHLCRKWQCLICCWVCCSGGMWRHHSDTKDAFTAQ